MFEKTLEKYKDGEFKLLVAKAIDKYNFCKTRNKITYTDFLNISEIAILKRIFKSEHINNYVFFGGKDETDRSILIFYPEKLSIELVEKNYNKILKIVRIKFPNNIKYAHKDVLSGIMKLGIRREKIGDIIIDSDGSMADIITFTEIAEILSKDLNSLIRFRKSNIEILDISEIINKNIEFDNINIIVSSVRLDNFVSELGKCSRNNAIELIENGKVYINSINEYKASKKININDIITIRGKGKFIFDHIEKETKSGKYLLNIRKYK